MPLTAGSLFAGIGGFDLAAEAAGLEVRWQIEIDPFCRRVLAKHWPTVTRYSDVRTCGAHNLESVDVLFGGFPCQDVSQAGLRAGIDGQRSGLWAEFHRIIRELRDRPDGRLRYVVIENVAGLLLRGIDRVLGDLAALGFDAWWTVIRASDMGAPHRRERVFIVAYLADAVPRGGRELHAPAVADCDRAHVGLSRAHGGDAGRAGGELAHAIGDTGGEHQQRERGGEADHGQEPEPSGVGRVADAVRAERGPQRAPGGDVAHRADAGRQEAAGGPGARGAALADAESRGLGIERRRAAFDVSDARATGLSLAEREAVSGAGRADEGRATEQLRGAPDRAVADADGAGCGGGGRDGSDHTGDEGRLALFLGARGRPSYRPDWLGDVQSDGYRRAVADAAGVPRAGGAGEPDVDAARYGSTWHGWPARPGESQAWWEPPRVLRRAESGLGIVPDGLPAGLVRHRRRALAALGNAIVPHVPVPCFTWVVAHADGTLDRSDA
jgi:site-specific DNA-cytosine methylase